MRIFILNFHAHKSQVQFIYLQEIQLFLEKTTWVKYISKNSWAAQFIVCLSLKHNKRWPQKVGSEAEAQGPRLQGRSRSERDFLR